jgi:hypothetical protein
VLFRSHPDQPPQFNALGESTEVVSIGMGGNDGGLFGTLVQGCSEIDTKYNSTRLPARNSMKPS